MRSLTLLTTLSLSLALAGCADEPTASASLALEADGILPPLKAISRGQRELLVEGIANVENALFLRDGRLLVSGDDGLFELVRAEEGFVALPRHPKQPCNFGAMAELAEAIYAVCYDGTRSLLFGARTQDELSFRHIADIQGVSLANGAAAGGERELLVTASGQGKIVRLTVSESDPLRISAQSNFRANSGGLIPNGLDVHEGTAYWGDIGSIRRGKLGGNERELLVAQLTFFDDLHVDARGLLVTDFLLGTLRAFDLRGRQLARTPALFSGPSAVVPALGRLGLGEADLVVTEKLAGVVSVFRPTP
jgi:hypothetical protein